MKQYDVCWKSVMARWCDEAMLGPMVVASCKLINVFAILVAQMLWISFSSCSYSCALLRQCYFMLSTIYWRCQMSRTAIAANMILTAFVEPHTVTGTSKNLIFLFLQKNNFLSYIYWHQYGKMYVVLWCTWDSCLLLAHLNGQIRDACQCLSIRQSICCPSHISV